MKTRGITAGLLAALAMAGAASPIFAQDGANGQDAIRSDSPPPVTSDAGRWLQSVQRRIPDLSGDQKTQIAAIYESAETEIRAARENGALTGDERDAIVGRIRLDLGNRIAPVLTPAQREQWQRTASNNRQNPPAGFGSPSGNGPTTDAQPLEKPFGKMLRRYEQAFPDFSEDQKNSIIELVLAGLPEIHAAREDKSLSENEREARITRLQEAIREKSLQLLTDSQRARWAEILEQERQAELAREFNLRPGETLEGKQARVLAPYIKAITGLTDTQKAQMLPIVDATSDVLEEIEKDGSRTPGQKQAILQRVRAATDAKLASILTKDQLAQWQRSQTQPGVATTAKSALVKPASSNAGTPAKPTAPPPNTVARTQTRKTKQ